MRLEEGVLPGADLKFDSKTQSNQSFRHVISEGVNILRVSEVESSRGEEDNILHEADLANKTIPRFGVVRDRMEYRVAYFSCRLGRPCLDLEGWLRLLCCLYLGSQCDGDRSRERRLEKIKGLDCCSDYLEAVKELHLYDGAEIF